jgi:phage terminase large subunit-like protein
MSIWVGVDASVKHDSTAIVAVTYDQAAHQVRLVAHRVFQPSPTDPIDFEADIERTLLDLSQKFYMRKCLFDPYQMQATAQRLVRQGLPIEEFPQSSPNLTAASQNLYDLVMGGGITFYPDAAMRLAASRAVAIETPRGWRIGKDKQTHKVDLIIALGMASHAAVAGAAENAPLDYARAYGDGAPGEDDSTASWQRARRSAYLASGGLVDLAKLW